MTETVATSATTFIIPVVALIALLVTGGFARLQQKPLTKWQYGILFLGVLSGIVHIGMGLTGDILLLLNGIGYHVLLGVLFIPAGFLADKKQILRLLIIGYTIVTFVGYFLSHPVGDYDSIGLFTKAVEGALVICLVNVKRHGVDQAMMQSLSSGD